MADGVEGLGGFRPMPAGGTPEDRRGPRKPDSPVVLPPGSRARAEPEIPSGRLVVIPRRSVEAQLNPETGEMEHTITLPDGRTAKVPPGGWLV